MQARKFCFYPGTNPTDCITTWPAAAVGFVNKTGDTMSGPLVVTKNFSGAIAPPTSTARLNLSTTGMSSGNVYALDVNAWHAGGSTPGLMTGVNVYAQSNGGTGGTSIRGVDSVVTPDVGSNLYSGAGVAGWYYPTTDFTNVQYGYGVQGYAINQAPTKWMPQMNGVFGDAEGKANLLVGVRGDATSLVSAAGVNQITGVTGNAYLHSVFQTPLAIGVYGQVYGDRSAGFAYGVDGEIFNVNDSISQAAGVNARVINSPAYAWGDVSGVSSTVSNVGPVSNLYGVKSIMTQSGLGSFSGNAWGVYSDASAVPGSWGSANIGDAIGVYGANNTGAVGAFGFGPHGVVGVGAPGGDGVYAIDGGANTFGVEAHGNNAGSSAFYGDSSGAGAPAMIVAANGAGADGIHASGTQYAIYATGTTIGVMSMGGIAGLYGISYDAVTPGTIGVGGNSISPNGTAISGLQQGNNGTGVQGYATASNGRGGYLISNGVGSYNVGIPIGVHAVATTTLSSNPDVEGWPVAANGSGVYAKGYNYGVYSDGNVYVNSQNGITMNNADRPIITRGWDTFTSGAYSGVGRWGLFMEPANLTLGIPAVAGRNFQVVTYNANSTIANRPLFIGQTGDMHSSGTQGGYYFADRSNAAREWALYSTGGTARLWNNSAGDMMTMNDTTGAVYNKKNLTTWDVTSDGRLKDVNGYWYRGIDDLMKLNVVTFNYKQDNARGLDSNTTHEGVIAQEAMSAIPESFKKDTDGYFSMNTDPIFWTMVNSIKDLKKQNDSLNARVDSLEARLEKLEAASQ